MSTNEQSPFKHSVLNLLEYITDMIIDIVGFNTTKIHCDFMTSIKDNGKDSDIFHTFNLTEPPGHMIKNTPTNVLYHKVTKERMEYMEFSIRDEHGRLIDFNADVFSFTLDLV